MCIIVCNDISLQYQKKNVAKFIVSVYNLISRCINNAHIVNFI